MVYTTNTTTSLSEILNNAANAFSEEQIALLQLQSAQARISESILILEANESIYNLAIQRRQNQQNIYDESIANGIPPTNQSELDDAIGDEEIAKLNYDEAKDEYTTLYDLIYDEVNGLQIIYDKKLKELQDAELALLRMDSGQFLPSETSGNDINSGKNVDIIIPIVLDLHADAEIYGERFQDVSFNFIIEELCDMVKNDHIISCDHLKSAFRYVTVNDRHKFYLSNSSDTREALINTINKNTTINKHTLTFSCYDDPVSIGDASENWFYPNTIVDSSNTLISPPIGSIPDHFVSFLSSVFFRNPNNRVPFSNIPNMKNQMIKGLKLSENNYVTIGEQFATAISPNGDESPILRAIYEQLLAQDPSRFANHSNNLTNSEFIDSLGFGMPFREGDKISFHVSITGTMKTETSSYTGGNFVSLISVISKLPWVSSGRFIDIKDENLIEIRPHTWKVVNCIGPSLSIMNSQHLQAGKLLNSYLESIGKNYENLKLKTVPNENNLLNLQLVDTDLLSAFDLSLNDILSASQNIEMSLNEVSFNDLAINNLATDIMVYLNQGQNNTLTATNIMSFLKLFKKIITYLTQFISSLKRLTAYDIKEYADYNSNFNYNKLMDVDKIGKSYLHTINQLKMILSISFNSSLTNANRLCEIIKLSTVIIHIFSDLILDDIFAYSPNYSSNQLASLLVQYSNYNKDLISQRKNKILNNLDSIYLIKNCMKILVLSSHTNYLKNADLSFSQPDPIRVLNTTQDIVNGLNNMSNDNPKDTYKNILENINDINVLLLDLVTDDYYETKDYINEFNIKPLEKEIVSLSINNGGIISGDSIIYTYFVDDRNVINYVDDKMIVINNNFNPILGETLSFIEEQHNSNNAEDFVLKMCDLCIRVISNFEKIGSNYPDLALSHKLVIGNVTINNIPRLEIDKKLNGEQLKDLSDENSNNYIITKFTSEYNDNVSNI